MVGNFNPNLAYANGHFAANAFCQSEAAFHNQNLDYPWTALSSGSISDDNTMGLERLGFGAYYDTITGQRMLQSRSSVNSFILFVDGSQTNGGGWAEWSFMQNVPRTLSSTQFWYGDSSCNCSDWSSTAAPRAGCTMVRGGVLPHSAQEINYLLSLPQTSTSAGLELHGYCETPKHVVYSQSPP